MKEPALVATRLSGLALFLPVPIVLWLFTRAPLGVPRSLGLGVLLMLTHRLYARPWALRRAASRCLWCADRADGALPLGLEEPFGATTWQACGAPHLEKLRSTLGWARAHAAQLKLGILVGLALFLPGLLLAAAGRLGPVLPADCVAFFRLSVAFAVLPLGWLGPHAVPSAADPLPVPFPVHIQALIGTWAVLWLFRLVGVAWLALGAWHFAGRLALLG